MSDEERWARAMAEIRATNEAKKLPEGKACGDCVHVRRCRAFGFTSSESNTNCDFLPNRFVTAAEVEKRTQVSR